MKPERQSVIQSFTRCSRRDTLRVGVLSALGYGLTDWFQSGSCAKETVREGGARAKSCILLWLDGGPSHLETFDLKPNAPSEVRGPFRPIATNVAGIQISELLPETARHAEKLAIIRSMTSPLGEHGLAHHYLLTGYKPTPALHYPSYGAVVARCRTDDSALPPYVAIPEARAAGAGYLGGAYEPFVTGGDPSHHEFRVQHLDLFPEVDEMRLARRREFLRQMDQVQAEVESQGDRLPSGFEQAYRLVSSPEAKRAFDLSSESAETRARYGPRMFGQSCLLARRLVERGVPFVTVTNTGWDTHEDLVTQLKLGYTGAQSGVGLIPTFDLGFSALLADLADRGLLEQTLVVAMGEFGRTPKLNARGGRDHWPRVFSVVLAGGGVRGGQVVGESDRVGESPIDRPVTPNDLARTVYTLLGIDADRNFITSTGRPVAVNQGGQMIPGII